MFNKILVVCAGNICRSPTAEYLLKAKIKNQANKQVDSAGLTALVGKGADKTAAEVAAEYGIDLSPHSAQQLTAELISEYDLILVMEQRHLDDIHLQFPAARGKTFLLGKWLDNIDIPDPYRKQKPAFEHVYKLIDEAATAWARYL